MSAFWYNFFSNGWVSSGLLIALPIFVLICLTVASILLEHSGEHGKWQEERDNVFKEYKLAVDYHDKREAKRLHQQYRALKKTEPINQIAKKHHGGGHPLASGANAYSLEETEDIYQEIQSLF